MKKIYVPIGGNGEIGYSDTRKDGRTSLDGLFHEMLNIFDSSPFSKSMLSVTDDLQSLRQLNDVSGRLSVDSKYPPFNIIQDNETKDYILEFAVAGFSKDNLEVTVEDNILTVSGKIIEEPYNSKDSGNSDAKRFMFHRGISRRSFTRAFTIPKYSQLADNSIKLHNGILEIRISKSVPEEKKLRKLNITDTSTLIDKLKEIK